MEQLHETYSNLRLGERAETKNVGRSETEFDHCALPQAHENQATILYASKA